MMGDVMEPSPTQIAALVAINRQLVDWRAEPIIERFHTWVGATYGADVLAVLRDRPVQLLLLQFDRVLFLRLCL